MQEIRSTLFAYLTNKIKKNKNGKVGFVSKRDNDSNSGYVLDA